LADDFKTLDGREYKDATVQGVEIDGIRVKTKSGISKLFFSELPKEVQDRFGYGTPQNRYAALQQQEYDLLQQIGEAEQAKACLKNAECKRKAKHTGGLSEMAKLAARLPVLHKALDDLRVAKADLTRQLEQTQQPQQESSPTPQPPPAPPKAPHKHKKKPHK
jgi:hypothetical protein